MKNIYFIFIGLVIGLIVSNFTIQASSNSNYQTILEDYTNINKSYEFSLHNSNVNIVYNKLHEELRIEQGDKLSDKLYSCYKLTNKIGNDLKNSYKLEQGYIKEIDNFYNQNCN